MTTSYDLSPSEFEREVASLLATQGYRDVTVIGGTGDLGVDIRCYDQDGNLVVVQCKRYAPNRRVGSPAIQQFMAMALHHRAQRKIFVTTASYTPQAIALAHNAEVELIDGDALGVLIHQSRPLARYPDPDVPIVLPVFSADRPDPTSFAAHQAALAARRAWLAQLHPETPVISRPHWVPTEEEERAWRKSHDRLLALTPEQFRKACVLGDVAGWEDDRPEIRLLENQNGSIMDYAIMMRPQPWLRQCHHLPGEQAVTAEQTAQFIRFAESQGYEPVHYRTSGLFTAGALLQHQDRGLSRPSTADGWGVAFWLLPGIYPYSKDKDFIGLAQQPGWPKKVLEGTRRKRLVQKLFG